jgi:aminoglycoside 6'-N-acetyltransferase I
MLMEPCAHVNLDNPGDFGTFPKMKQPDFGRLTRSIRSYTCPTNKISTESRPQREPCERRIKRSICMNIRAYESNDNAEWLRLRRRLWPDIGVPAHRQETAAWLSRPDAVVLVADRTGGSGLAGFAEVGCRSVADGCETSPVAYLEGWYVDMDMRRKGIGSALIRAAETWARARGLRELASDAELANVASQRAHEALGFTETSRAVLYLKAL